MNRTLLKFLGPLILAGLLAALYLNPGTAITILADGERRTVTTHTDTVGEALHEAGVSVYPEDGVEPPLDARLAPSITISVERASLVRVEADGQTLEVRTRLSAPAAILAWLGLSLGPQDEVWADGVRVDPARPVPPSSTAPRHILLRRAFTVIVLDGQGAVQLETAAPTVGDALWRAGYRLYQADQVEPALDAPATPLLHITIHRSRPITVLADGQALPTRTRRSTVGEVLGDVGLALVGQDFVVPAADAPLPADGTIRVVRVRDEVLDAQELIPFDTLYQARADWEIDHVALVQAGANGVKSHRVRVRYADGVEVSRVDEGTTIALAPVSRVIAYGTQIVVRSVDTPDGPVEYWRSYSMYATSYSPKRSGTPETAPWYGRTASGKLLTKGLVAIDRRLIPFGMHMYIPGYGFAVAADTGSGVKGRFIDLGYDDDNYVSWHQVVTVYFVTPIPPLDQITWIIPSTVP